MINAESAIVKLPSPFGSLFGLKAEEAASAVAVEAKTPTDTKHDKTFFILNNSLKIRSFYI
jgi:hypothetical protein